VFDEACFSGVSGLFSGLVPSSSFIIRMFESRHAYSMSMLSFGALKKVKIGGDASCDML
jgi:hypothetical protein